jgi:hypothetical protein
MEDASTTIHSLINSINKAYGTSFTTLDIVDGVFAPLTQTSVTITFKPTSTYFNDSGSITLTVLGTYRIDDGKVVGTPVVYDYMPGVWDERTAGLQATTKQTGVKWSVLHHTYRVDYTPIGNILARFQGMSYTADTRRLTRTYWRDILLPNALKSVDGLDWCNDTLSVRPFNLYLGYILYNGPANRCKGYFANMAATLFEQYATDLVDTTYDYVMILSGGVGGYLPAVIHYNLGTIRS